MTLLRDAAVSLLHRAGIRQITARLRYHSQHPASALALLLTHKPFPWHPGSFSCCG